MQTSECMSSSSRPFNSNYIISTEDCDFTCVLEDKYAKGLQFTTFPLRIEVSFLISRLANKHNI